MRGTLVLVAAGAVAALALQRWLPLPAGDPFRGTLAILPLVLAALAAIHRSGRHAGGRAIPLRARAWELPAVAVLVAAVLARSSLGLPGADEVLAAGLALVLGHRVLRQLLALRPLLGRRLPRRPSALFFLLPLTAYCALIPWSTFHRPPDGDEPYYLLITHSLAEDLDADLADEYAAGAWRSFMARPLEPQPGDPVGDRGQVYSRHNELLPMALAPAYKVAGRAGALATMAALTALLAWWTLRLARHYGPARPGEALLAYGLLAFAPPLLLYSYQVWVEVPAALLAVVALDAMLDPVQGTRGRRYWLAVSLPVLLLPLLKIRFALLAVPLVALAWWHAGRPRKPLILLSLALAAVGAGILVHNQIVFGNPLKIHHVEELALTDYPAVAYLRGTLGLFWDAAFGLFAAAPLWLLVLPALVAAARSARPRETAAAPPAGRGGQRRWILFDLAVLATPYLLVVVPRNEWYGGWSPPFRYALIALPLLALMLVPALTGRRRGGARALAAGLGAASLALTLLWLAVPGWTYNFADGRTYLLDHLDARLAADAARLFPSSLRPRAATWLWPLASVVLVPLVWARPRRRLPAAAAWGVTALLAAAAALPVVAGRLPTRVVEVEDPWVAHSGGGPYPERWIVERTRFRGGWVLPEGTRAEVQVVPGGDRVLLRIAAIPVLNHPDRAVELEVTAGAVPLGRWRLAAETTWQTHSLGPLPWPAGETLGLKAVAPRGAGEAGAINGVVVDRVDLEWR
jgi:hypothetical protein